MARSYRIREQALLPQHDAHSGQRPLKQALHLLQDRAVHLAGVDVQAHVTLQHVELGIEQVSTGLEYPLLCIKISARATSK